MGVGHIHRMSVHNAPTVNPPGIPVKSIKGDRLIVNTAHWQGRSWRCDPRQIAYSFSNGNEAYMHVREIGTPEMFWRSIGLKKKRPGWVMGRFWGEPGRPAGPVKWTPLAWKHVPSRAGGILARISSNLGMERGMENIVACQGEGRDVIVTHISEGTDRRLVIINEDGWKDKRPEREKLMKELDCIYNFITDIEKQELSDDGRTLTLYLNILDASGQPARYDLDVSCLKLDPSKIYRNPKDKKFSIKLITPDEHTDHECEERTIEAIIPNPSTQNTPSATVTGYRDEKGELNFSIKPKDGSGKIHLKGKSISEVKKDPEYMLQPPETRRAIKKAEKELLDIDNFEWTPPKKINRRFAILFHVYRETRFKNILDAPLQEGESIVITKVKSASEVVHLNEMNGRPKGFIEIIPYNFNPSYGKKKNFELMRTDPRPHALYTIRFCSPVSTAIAPQHLIDIYVMGTEIMATIWPKIDQLGFFGVNMLAAMAFPYGKQFMDPAKLPWYVRAYATVSHSIFDAKSDAGRLYYLLTGNPALKGMKEAVGAAMVTGPNTDAVNPAREGRLFYSRIPGMRPHKIKTAIPGFYVEVVEDALVSYMDMTMFGLLTETTTDPLSAGGGLENYQTASIVQRAKRWNAGNNIYLKDAAQEILIDRKRGNRFYHAIYNFKSGLDQVSKVGLKTTARRDILGKLQPSSEANKTRKVRAYDPHRPVAKKFKPAEKKEWENVGTWFLYSFAKKIFYLSIFSLITFSFLPIPVVGSMFLVACLACTFLAWPFWNQQMMKVGVNPQGIMSLFPIHLFWGDQPMRTMSKSGLDIERLGVGKFVISTKELGNRIPTKDKRFAIWVTTILPTYAGSILLASGALISLLFGFGILTSALPYLGGLLASRMFSRFVKRILPNPNNRSWLRGKIRRLASQIPFLGGIIGSLIAFGNAAIIAIPLVTAVMAGGWALFMGANMINAWKRYFREQRQAHAHMPPNPVPKTIPRHQADTWRNAWREAWGKQIPLFTPDEFTRLNDKNICPYKLWNALESAFPNLLNKPDKSPIKNLNRVMESIDLYERFKWMSPLWNKRKRRKIDRLAKKTRADRAKLPGQDMDAEQFDRIKELNRLILEEVYPEFTPRKNI
ncbi:hypothetical protein AMJ44_05790 [candidate division WOR-1 bacterium DG_54_3]|uniref:Uncharacterized protein n=1 Tax=candidate division WOR-1 bacterium DG_54_3 TaxID=1703775 RepID=A0A0S7Y1M9_UNCSA|nr:MAG: hypothetical protein AMJ44_05790 [candidate division WOR-1 bacterium DG_54_3]